MSSPAPLTWLKKLHVWACQHEALLLFLTLVLMLRLPTLTEPYWYGDEAIYLTIGTALRQGAVLYRDIVDHKTPVIYYLAMVPHQVWFRVLLTGWMLVTTAVWYQVVRRLFTKRVSWLMTLIFILATSIPFLEGNIPNGELFVMGFVIWSWYALLQTKLGGTALFAATSPNTAQLAVKLETIRTQDNKWLLLSGFLSGLAILTKVPAVLDVAALVVLALLSAWHWVTTASHRRQALLQVATRLGWFVLGVLLPITASLAYFAGRGALADYVQYGLLYNFHYTSNWNVPLPWPSLQILLRLPFKALLLALLLIKVIWFWWRRPTQRGAWWTAWWFLAALIAATLSHRPYPHYLLQVVPPAILGLGYLLSTTTQWRTRALQLLLFMMGGAWLTLLQFSGYETVGYYQRFWQYATGQMSASTYRQSFNNLVAQNEELLPLITANTTPQDRIFIWGTNPMLYAQARRVPAGQFTVAFHIHDLQAYAPTLAAIQASSPKYIIVMKNEAPWPELKAYLDQYYLPMAHTADMRLYRRTRLVELVP